MHEVVWPRGCPAGLPGSAHPALGDARRGDTGGRGRGLRPPPTRGWPLASSCAGDSFFVRWCRGAVVWLLGACCVKHPALVPAAKRRVESREVSGGAGAASGGFPLVGYFILPNCWRNSCRLGIIFLGLWLTQVIYRSHVWPERFMVVAV